MNKPKLIIFEAADGLGKSTQASLMAERLDARLIAQPANDGLVGNFRYEAKNNPALTALERQLFIGISHTVDAFTKFNDDKNVVMDRSILSGIVYGEMTDAPKYELGLLMDALIKIYTYNMQDRYDVHFVFLNGDKRFNSTDTDVFEQSIKWEALQAKYVELYNKVNLDPIFSSDALAHLIDITGDKLETHNKIAKAVGVYG